MTKRRGLWAQITEWVNYGPKFGRHVFRTRARGGTRRLMTADQDMSRTAHPSRRRRRRTRRYNVSGRS